MIRRVAIAGSIFALAACPPAGSPGSNGKGTNVVIADVDRVDAAVPVVGDDGPPVQPGSEGDVIGRVFTLGTEPTVPSAFGKLKPWMTRAEAKQLLPADWGGAWSHGMSGEPNVMLGVGEAEGTDDPLEHLDLTFDQAGSAWRLEQAWGKPDLRGYDKSASCWLAPATKLKACHSNHLGHDVVELATYVPLTDALAKSSPRALATLVARIGQAKADVLRAFPHHQIVLDDVDPTKNRIEVTFPATEYMASAHADRVLLYLDAKDRVHSISVRYGANDPDLRPTLVQDVRAATELLASGKDAPSVTVLESEPLDVVVVLDRAGALQ